MAKEVYKYFYHLLNNEICHRVDEFLKTSEGVEYTFEEIWKDFANPWSIERNSHLSPEKNRERTEQNKKRIQQCFFSTVWKTTEKYKDKSKKLEEGQWTIREVVKPIVLPPEYQRVGNAIRYSRDHAKKFDFLRDMKIEEGAIMVEGKLNTLHPFWNDTEKYASTKEIREWYRDNINSAGMGKGNFKRSKIIEIVATELFDYKPHVIVVEDGILEDTKDEQAIETPKKKQRTKKEPPSPIVVVINRDEVPEQYIVMRQNKEKAIVKQNEIPPNVMSQFLDKELKRRNLVSSEELKKIEDEAGLK
jgi:hypothetical protein